ncbi:hypothetical protein F5878DRAFT_619257 [Lentinula raphanica]|uniref:F-box domain-containing protein n=1 Tax=Lentinula raphanica TaxID=153919 RepID=A0AA38P904_9AGAR|nr:hypothetical protein F5878DRAFT_619257 [Lentinula raphanica]
MDSHHLPTPTHSPIHTLPNELLSHIFLHIASRPPGQFSLSELDLSHVCSQWRAVALNLSPLWSSIQILAHEDPNSEGVRRLTELYLDRSGNAPLDVFLHIDVEAGRPELGLGLDLMDMLSAHAHRWRHAHLYIPRGSFFELYASDLELSSLESFSLTLDGSNPNPFDGISSASGPGTCMSFTAPRLHTLHLNIPFFELSQFLFPFHQLRHLSTSHLDLSLTHQLLSLSPSLLTASFASCPTDYSFRDPIPYTSPLLSSLTILALHRLETLGPDITRCVFPSLTTLTLISGAETSEFSFSHGIVPDLTSLVIRSQCHLASLTLHGISYSSKHLMELLHASSPSLLKLDLCDVDHRAWNFMQLERWVFEALTIRWLHGPQGDAGLHRTVSSSSSLLPHLREFGIRFPGSRRDVPPDRAKLNALLDMIESRCQGYPESNPDPASVVGIRTRKGLDRTSANAVLQNQNQNKNETRLEKLHLGRLWATRVPVEVEKRLRALEDGGLKITAV